MISNKYHIGRKRAVALILDSMLLYAPLLAVTSNARTFQNFVLIEIATALYPILKILYFVLCHYYTGQTLAQSVLNIKVVDVSESRNISFKQAVMRDLVWIVIESYILIIYFLRSEEAIAQNDLIVRYGELVEIVGALWFALEVVTVLTNKDRRSINDLIAGTVVIRTD